MWGVFVFVLCSILTISMHFKVCSGTGECVTGRKEVFYLTTHSTHFIYGYMASDMFKDHSDSERGNPMPPHRLLFPISSKGSLISNIPQTR